MLQSSDSFEKGNGGAPCNWMCRDEAIKGHRGEGEGAEVRNGGLEALTYGYCVIIVDLFPLGVYAPLSSFIVRFRAKQKPVLTDVVRI